jgi:hypothetical protein
MRLLQRVSIAIVAYSSNHANITNSHDCHRLNHADTDTNTDNH